MQTQGGKIGSGPVRGCFLAGPGATILLLGCALPLVRAELFPIRFFEEPLVQGNFAAWGRTFSLKSNLGGKTKERESSVPGSAAAPDKWFLQQKSLISGEKTVPGSAVAPNKWLLQKMIFEKSSAPGSAAAPDKWLLQGKV